MPGGILHGAVGKVNTNTVICTKNSVLDIEFNDVLENIYLLMKYIKKHAKNKDKNRKIL